MKLYKDYHSRAYRGMYLPYAKKWIPKLLKDTDESIRQYRLEEGTRLGYMWNSESGMFGKNNLDYIFAIVDSRASGIEISGEWMSPRTKDMEYRTYSYHIYDHCNHQISVWDRSIPIGCLSRNLIFKLGWLKETIHYGY